MSEFVRADSRNLPHMDMFMILEYFYTNDQHNVAEIRGVKTLMSSRGGYVDNAVGYVEIKRWNTECFVRAKVVPEHKIRMKYYLVTIHLEEANSNIIDATCDGCPASAGGCKHTLVVLYWLQKKSTEPLASEGTQPISSKDISTQEKRNRTRTKRSGETQCIL